MGVLDRRTVHCLAFLLVAGSLASAAPEVWVSPQGDDANSGERGTPVATLGRALALVREGRTPDAEGERIVLRGGIYRLAETLTLGPEDSGLTVEGAPGEAPVISGGRVVTGWKPWKGDILQADLSGLGLPDCEFRELYCDGLRQPLARVPNFDPARPRLGGFLYNAGIAEAGSKTKFRYRPGELDPTKWTHAERAIVVFHPSVNYEKVWAPLARVDVAERVIETARGVYALEPHDSYYLCNLLEELDAPGEWYADPDTQTLYFRPPMGAPPGEVVVPALQSAFVVQGDIEGGRPAEGIRIAHVDLRDFRGDAVHMTGAEECAVMGCDIRNVGVAVHLGDRTQVCTVAGCDITQTSGDGISIWGTPGEHDRVSGHLIDNNYIWDYGWGHLHNRTAGIWFLATSHCEITHNHIHDGPRYAIGTDVGNDNVIAYNYCHHVNLETCDTGIIEAATAWDWGKPDENERNEKFNRDNEIHHNLLHDSGGMQETGPGEMDFPTYSWGIYLDTHSSHWKVHDNVVYNTVLGGFMLNCGQDNVIENNIFVDGKTNQVQFNPWPKYVISGNRCERNIISYRGGGARLYTVGGFRDEFVHFASNLIWAGGVDPRIPGLTGVPLRQSWAKWLELGRDEGSLVADPLFVDAANRDYRLRPDSPALALGFEPIDLSEVGNRRTPDRRTWPRPEEPVIREPADYTPPETVGATQPPLRDYEASAVGDPEQGAHAGEAGGLASVRVTDESAASGDHSLKVSETTGLKNAWEPYITYMLDAEEGVWEAGFDLRVEADADVVYEWRDDPYHYNLGPNLHVQPDGWLLANGKQLLQLPVGEWVRLDVKCGLGEQATGTYDLTVKLADGEPETFPAVPCSPQFSFLSCVVVMSVATQPTAFYLDNVEFNQD
ncbi:MAG: hypothetical protein FJX74_02530 [Armatimonadetes bacterium]|nr:hypothetical protein [Armatimonadota bacterium]